MFLSLVEYPPLTSPEIEGIACRIKIGEPLSREEVDRLYPAEIVR